MNEPTAEQFAQQTAEDILTRYAPDCLNRHGLRDAIARLAHQGIEISIRLYQTHNQQPPALGEPGKHNPSPFYQKER